MFVTHEGHVGVVFVLEADAAIKNRSYHIGKSLARVAKTDMNFGHQGRAKRFRNHEGKVGMIQWSRRAWQRRAQH